MKTQTKPPPAASPRAWWRRRTHTAEPVSTLSVFRPRLEHPSPRLQPQGGAAPRPPPQKGVRFCGWRWRMAEESRGGGLGCREGARWRMAGVGGRGQNSCLQRLLSRTERPIARVARAVHTTARHRETKNHEIWSKGVGIMDCG